MQKDLAIVALLLYALIPTVPMIQWAVGVWRSPAVPALVFNHVIAVPRIAKTPAVKHLDLPFSSSKRAPIAPWMIEIYSWRVEHEDNKAKQCDPVHKNIIRACAVRQSEI